MLHRRSLLSLTLSSSLSFSAIACGGATSIDATNRGSAGVHEQDGAGCHTLAVPADRACVPALARAGSAITLDVQIRECASADMCKVQVADAKVTLALSSTSCAAGGDDGASATIVPMCRTSTIACALPPLAAGRYEVELSGETPRTGLPARELVVADGAAETSCALASAIPSRRDDYGRTCSVDADCAVVALGDPCARCACPDAAIAAEDVARYEAETRAASSQCSTFGAPAVSCAACAPRAAWCNDGVCAVR